MGSRGVIILTVLSVASSCRTSPQLMGDSDKFVPDPRGEPQVMALPWVEGARLAWRVEERFSGRLAEGSGVSSRLLIVDATWNVTGVDGDGGASVSLTFDRVRLDEEQPGGRSSFDTGASGTSGEGTPRVERLARALVGTEARFEISGDGRVRGFVPAGPMDETSALARIGAMPRLLGSAGCLQALETLALLPREAVVTDDRWTCSDERTMPYGRLRIDIDLVYRGRVERDERLASRIDFSKRLTALDSVETDRGIAALQNGGAKGSIYVGRGAMPSFSLIQRGSATLELRSFGRVGTQRMKSSLLISLSP